LELRAILYVLLAIAVATTAISLIGPSIDLAIAGLFYDPATRKFLAVNNPYLIPLREHGSVAIATCIGIVVLALLRLLPWRLPGVPPRNAIALTLALIIGPGILVNGILKPYSGRPRPIEVTQFGGNLKFVDWWNMTGGCEGNCSFMSGEGTTAAWMFGPAMLVPPPWRGLAIGAAAVFAGGIGLLRMAAGAHFFTDILIGAIVTILILLALNRLIAGASGLRPERRSRA
jgi:lipid A 4'-phosphatase